MVDVPVFIQGGRIVTLRGLGLPGCSYRRVDLCRILPAALDVVLQVPVFKLELLKLRFDNVSDRD